ncbi:MAG: FtsX-like permease family protein [Nocardioides sp.]
MGASTPQVFTSVIVEAFAVGVLGSTVGLGFGLVLAKLLQALFEQFGLDLSGQSVVVTATTVLAAYLIGCLVTVGSASLPAWRTRHIAPVQALNDTVALPEGSVTRRFVLGLVMVAGGVAAMAWGLLGSPPHAGWITVLGALGVLLGTSIAAPVLGRPLLDLARRVFGGLFGTVGRLAGENTRRNPRRTTVTASALMIGLALACAVAILGESGKQSTAQVVAESFSGDYVVANATGQPFSPAIARKMGQVPGVTQVMRQRYAVASADGRQQFFGAIDPSGLGSVVQVSVVEGSLADFTDDTVLVDRGWAESRDLHAGDPVTWTMPSGRATYTVAAVVKPAPLLALPAVTIETLHRAGFPDQDGMLLIEGNGDLLPQLEKIVADNPLVTVNDQTGLIEQQNKQADQGLLMIYGLLALALIIAVLGIVNTLALSVIERTREIGLLRAVGMSRAQLRRMVTLESVAIAVLGSVLGLLLGLFFGFAVGSPSRTTDSRRWASRSGSWSPSSSRLSSSACWPRFSRPGARPSSTCCAPSPRSRRLGVSECSARSGRSG